jgi:hypothetical protein
MRQLRAGWLALVIGLAMLLAAGGAALAQAGGADDEGATSSAGVTVSVDATSYAPGDPITATVTNGGSLAISPGGGIVCQGSPWPLRVQALDASGSWQDLEPARTPPCVAIAATLLPPGQSLSKTFAASADPGQYRVVFAFHATDGSDASAASDPFLVGSPGS